MSVLCEIYPFFSRGMREMIMAKSLRERVEDVLSCLSRACGGSAFVNPVVVGTALAGHKWGRDPWPEAVGETLHEAWKQIVEGHPEVAKNEAVFIGAAYYAYAVQMACARDALGE